MKQDTPQLDVVVVGAGPAGATSAYLLAKGGFNVCLVDKNPFPRPKLCAGLLTWKSIDLLERVFGYAHTDLMDRGVITNTCRNYRIYLGPKLLIRRRLEFPFHLVDRLSYDNFWLQQAQKAGCQIATGRRVTRVDPIQGEISFSDGRQLRAKSIIGADGVWSVVRRAIEAGSTDALKWRRQLAATIETRRTGHPLHRDNAHASIHFGYMPWGYAWSFPGNGHQVVGIGGLHRKSHQSLAMDFRGFLNAMHIEDTQLDPMQSHPLPYGNHIQRPAQGRALLVGDACGLADPLLGEGIYYAHRSGELVAHALLAAGLNPSKAAKIYTQNLNTHILKEFRWIKLYRNLLFVGGRRRRFRGLRLFLHLMPERLEAAVHGRISYSKLLWPGNRPPAIH